MARGEPLPLQQADVPLHRCRTSKGRPGAESPADGFLPGSGTVADWSVPDTVRCDHALDIGTEVPAWYDSSMVAKLVAHAPTRAQCVEAMARALDDTVLLGVQSNRSFLAQLVRHPDFALGQDVSTAFIDAFRSSRIPAVRSHCASVGAGSMALIGGAPKPSAHRHPGVIGRPGDRCRSRGVCAGPMPRPCSKCAGACTSRRAARASNTRAATMKCWACRLMRAGWRMPW